MIDLLDGNEAMKEIWLDAQSRIEAGVELAPAQKVVLNEWVIRAQAKVNLFRISQESSTLTAEEESELSALEKQIEKTRQALLK